MSYSENGAGFMGASLGDDGDIVVQGLPYSHGSPAGGLVSDAPATLRALMRGERIQDGVVDYGNHCEATVRLSVADSGDFPYHASMSRKAYFDGIESRIYDLARACKIPLTLGGDHSITLPVAAAVARARGRIQVVILDAHHDDSAVTANTRPTHSNFVRFLDAEPAIEVIIQLGLRGLSSFMPQRPAKVCEATIDELSGRLLRGVPVYLSIDTDAFDPAIAPAVMHPEPGGLRWEDLDRVTRALADCGCSVVGVDWTEYDPGLEDRNHRTGIAVARALTKLVISLKRPPPPEPQVESRADGRETFPFDVMDSSWLRIDGGERGRTIDSLKNLSLSPPFPWGQWLYGRLLEERLPALEGDLIECGVAKGGMSLFLAGFAAGQDRRLFALDSFAGLPCPDDSYDNPYFQAGDYSARPDRGDLYARFCDACEQTGFERIITPVRGLLADTLPTLPLGIQFAFAHIDVDLYRSALLCLEHLWPRMREGALLVIDDFFHHSQGPFRAAGEFFRGIGQSPLYHVSFPYSVVVVKGETRRGISRSIDGNRYTLDWLRRDPLLRKATSAVADRLKARGPSRALTNAVLLRNLLQPEEPDRSADVYDYWRALEAYWDDMDVSEPENREFLRI